MSISKDLFLTILSMDSYNRGYNAGFTGLSESDDGSVRIGNAGIHKNLFNYNLVEDAEDVSFYAISYQMEASVGSGTDMMAAGETIISYRGTDRMIWELPLIDIPIFTGDYDERQIYLAS